MDKLDLELRIDELEEALRVAIEALGEYVGNDDCATIDYLERILEGSVLDDLDLI